MTDVSLKEYIETQIKHERSISEAKAEVLAVQLEEFRIYYNAQLESVRSNTGTVAEEVARRFASQNEWRQAMIDRELRFVSRDEYNAVIISLSDNISGLRESRAKTEGMATQKSVMITFILAVLGMCISILSTVLRFQ